ncbi:hypothetical protein KY359_04765 [Candidatus Woesearchaeota archaeon]|nr:hypothetical protein [Candidatus Woesearchaeota archaeon]
MMIFGSKKGLSPLIAAVLLIVVVVGIGAVVTGMVREQVTQDKQTIQKTSTDIDCSTQVVINVPTFNDDFLICLGATGYVTATIENTGSLEVDELQLKVFGDAGFYDNDSITGSSIAPGQVLSNFIMDYDAGVVGNVQEVLIIPKKKVTGSSHKIYCGEAQLRFADIEPC